MSLRGVERLTRGSASCPPVRGLAWRGLGRATAWSSSGHRAALSQRAAAPRGLPSGGGSGSGAARGGARAAATHSQQQPTAPPAVGVVIVDHGSRAKASNDMLLEFVSLYKASTGQPIVEAAHMELAEPSIANAIARCAEQGAGRVVVAPYFLSRGRHVQQDVPNLVAAAAAAHPGLELVVADPIGIDPLMIQLISNRVQAAAAAGAAAGGGAAAAAPVLQGASLAVALAAAAAMGAAAAAATLSGVA